MSVELSLEKKTIFITGAAGRIGSKICEKCAEAGANLIMLDREVQSEGLDRLQKSLAKLYHVDCEVLVCDLCDNGLDFVEKLCKAGKEINVLVNCAGTNIIKPSLSITEEEWDMVLDTNLKSCFFLSQLLARYTVLNGTELLIINIGSQHGVVGNVDRAPYCSSKGGMVLLTKALAVEWAKYGIRVNCISPTYVVSENNRELLMNTQSKKIYLKEIPLGKYCTPEDVANTVLFLASPMAEFITGENIILDGGYTAK